MKFKFKNPLRKDQDVVIISNSQLKDLERLELGKEMAENSPDPDIDSDDQSDDFEDEDDFSRTETIDPIKLNKRRLDSLRQIYATLEKEEQEANLKLKILKKQEMIARKKNLYSQVMEIQAEKDKFYENPRDGEGYFILKEDKWNDEYDDWLIKLGKATNDTDRKAIQKELKRLEGIKSKNKTKNRMNRIIRGINKGTKTIGSISRGVGKFADEIGQMGNMGGNPQPRKKGGKGRKTTQKKYDFENFFSDKKSDGKQSEFDQYEDFFKTKKTVVVKKPATRKRKSKKKAKKKKKPKRKSSKSTSTISPPTPSFDNFFG